MLKKWLLMACLLIALVFYLAPTCGDDDDDNNDDEDDDNETDDDDATGDDDDATGDDDDSGDACSGEALCEFVVSCNLGFETVDECMDASDAELQNCANPDNYVECICACYLSDLSCMDYSTCGYQCYVELCS